MPDLGENEFQTLASKLAGFTARQKSTGAGKTTFEDVSVFYLGAPVKEHHPYIKDADGNKVEAGEKFGHMTYKKDESKSDGFMSAFRTPTGDLYVLTKSAPQLEIGALYAVSGKGYGRSGVPSYLDEDITMTKIAVLQACDPEEVEV